MPEPKRKRKSAKPLQASAYTIAEFCEKYNVARSSYFEMRNADWGPTEFRIGRAVRILREDARAWAKRVSGERIPTKATETAEREEAKREEAKRRKRRGRR